MPSKWIQRIERMLGRVYRAAIRLFFLLVVFGSGTVVFLHFQARALMGAISLGEYWPQFLIPLGTLIAFSGLLYNRARAVATTATRQRFRSLYAAERLFAATCFYLSALITTLFVALCGDYLVIAFGVPPPDRSRAVFTMLGLALPLYGWTVLEVYQAVRLITPSGAHRRTIRVARRVRQML